jgi:hypothetical protein
VRVNSIPSLSAQLPRVDSLLVTSPCQSNVANNADGFPLRRFRVGPNSPRPSFFALRHGRMLGAGLALS